MQRRSVLKGFSAAMGGVLLPRAAWTRAFDPESKPIATAIRGLARKGGKLLQPVRIVPADAKTGAQIITKLDGIAVDHRTLAEGVQHFDVFVDAVTTARTSRVSVSINGVEQTVSVELKPVRKMLVYVLPHSHHDLGYTDLQADVEEKQINNILQGMELARKTEHYPEGSRFVWNLEVLWGADLFLKRRPERDRVALREAVRKGWIGLNGSYANELTGLCRPEELMELFRFGTRLGKEWASPVRSAMMSDVPGFTWGTVMAMSQAGIRYFSAAPNFFDRIGSFMVAWQDKPFWWVSPSGKEKVLFWVPWTGYAMSHVMKLGDDFVDKYQDRMDAVSFPYDISYIRWSGHGDNAVPDPELSEWVKDWNTTYEWPKFHIATTETAFAAFEKSHGNKLPEFRGDLTPYWEDGAASSALETAMNRNAAERIVQAETLTAAFRPEVYDVAQYAEAWRNVLLYSEHTWGAYNSVSDSENPFVQKQWDVKRAFAVNAAMQADSLLQQAVGVGNDQSANIAVWNTTSWERSEVVILSKELSRTGDYAEDSQGRAVSTQRLTSGELAILVEKIPAFSKWTFQLSQKKSVPPTHPVTVEGETLTNQHLSVTVDAKTGDVVKLTSHDDRENLINTEKGAANRFLYLSGSDIDHLGRTGKPVLTVEDAGPLVATLRIESSAPSCNNLIRRVRVIAETDYVSIENIVDKQRAPLNPDPGKGGPGESFAQRGSKESIQFAFPLAVSDGKMTMDVPLAVMRPELDQLPGSDKNWLPVGRWVDVSSAERGITWATLDAPLVEIGGITATMLGSQRNPDVWRKKIEETQLLYSWVMNNHWGTNYLAYQQGPVTFRYALRPHRGNAPSEKERFATGLTQKLVVTHAVEAADTSEAMLTLSAEDVLVQSLKPSDDGRAWIVRLFNASEKAHDVSLAWAARAQAAKTWISNLAEEPVRMSNGAISIAGWQVVTVRVERKVAQEATHAR
jgi:alpha-mannosidase